MFRNSSTLKVRRSETLPRSIFPRLTALAEAYYPVLNLIKERVMEGKANVEITYCVP